MTRLTILTVVLLLTVTVTVTATASAGVARVDVIVNYGQTHNDVVYEAAAGERNAVTVTSDGPRRITFHDDGVTVSVGSGCASVDAHTATCTAEPAAWQIRLRVLSADLDDLVDSAVDPKGLGVAGIVDIDAGPGNGVVRGSGTLRGGHGEDELSSAAGATTSSPEVRAPTSCAEVRAATRSSATATATRPPPSRPSPTTSSTAKPARTR